MRRAWIRSSLFNVTFFIFNTGYCILILPMLLLPRRYYLIGVELYHFMLVALEYVILGLKYELRGEENIPPGGAFLVAAKHMSAYETFKLRLLFDDPAIILKKELLRIPVWGAHLKKTDVIAIDRSTPERALKSLEQGALRMQAQNRPIVIFPQGTRVRPEETAKDKPYKAGIYRMQKTTGLPIIPMATNSGLFWPRSGWLKSSGTVVFKFFPPIEPGLEKAALMKKLEDTIESESLSLMNEARINALETGGKIWLGLAFLLLLAAGLYSYAWFETAKTAKTAYTGFLGNFARTSFVTEPVISGFPGPVTLDALQQKIETQDFIIEAKIIQAKIWPLPFTPITLRTGPASIVAQDWFEPLEFESFEGKFFMLGNTVRLSNGRFVKGEFEAGVSGKIDLDQQPVPKIDITLALKNHAPFLGAMAQKGIIEERIAMFLTAGFSALADKDGIVRVPISQQGRRIFAGPLPIADLPADPSETINAPDDLPPLQSYSREFSE